MRRLGKEIASLVTQVRNLNRQPQLGHSSLEGGMNQYPVGSAVPGVRLGSQFDGYNGAISLSGPPPPKLASPTVTVTPLGLSIRWGGDYNPAIVPGDPMATPPTADTPVAAPTTFARVEVHAATSSVGFSATTFLTMQGSITSPRGGSFFLPLSAGTSVYVRLVLRTAEGGVSPASDIVGPFTVPGVGHADIDATIRDVLDGTLKPYWQTSAPTGLTATDKAIWFDTDNGNKVSKWNGSSWDPLPFGNGAIGPNSLVASDVIATNSITAELFSAVLVLATAFIAGNPIADHVRLDEDGLHVFAADPDGQLVEVGAFGTTGLNRLFIIDPTTGKTLVAVNQAGVAAPVGNFGQIYVGGNSLDYLLAQTAQGLLRRGGIRATTPTTTTSRGTFDLEFTAEPGHAYRIHTTTINLAPSTTATYGFAQIRVRPSADGPPTTGTGIALATGNGSENISGGVVPMTINRVAGFDELFPVGSVPTVPTKVRVLLCYGVASGGGNVAIFSDGAHPVDMYVEDIGPTQPYTGSTNDGAGGGGAGGGGVSVVTTVADFASTWGSNWQSTSTAPRTDTGDLIQGYTPAYTPPGSEVAMIGFQDLTGVLSGATINWMAVYLYANHWNDYDGGTALVGAHPYLNSPASRPADWQLNLIQSSGWPRAAGRWVYLPSTWFAGFKTGANRGITLGDLASTVGEYYGRFDGYPLSSRPVMRISYTK